MVHNLGLVNFRRLNDPFGFDWALEARSIINELIQKGDHKALIQYEKLGKPLQLAVPTPEHYLPLLYSLSLQHKDEPIEFFNDKAIAGSLTMTSLRIG